MRLMRLTITLLTAVVSLSLTPGTFAQRTLEKEEAQDILEQLLSRPRKTWIDAGTIQGTRYERNAPRTATAAKIQDEVDKAAAAVRQDMERRKPAAQLQEDPWALAFNAIESNVRYRLENAYEMTTSEVVTYDGERFRWEIDLASRSDSVPLDASLLGNFMVEHFKVHEQWNLQRVFLWDGQQYTTYSASGGQATVDAAGRMPRAVNGPLTAGLIPWGYGRFSAESLAAASVSARQIDSTLLMTITHADGSSSELSLDSSIGYAVTAARLTGTSGLVVTYLCSGYQAVAGAWVPTTVVIERQNADAKSKTPVLERWTNLTVTSTSVPSPAAFDSKQTLGLDTTVEYLSSASTSPAIYINSYEVDTDDLLAQRLAYASGEGRRRQNCATAALQHVASGFGRSVSDAGLANLVAPDGGTSLYDLRQAAHSAGLYSRVVKADLESLKNLGAARAILHLPGKNHFVVLDRVDDRYVWLINLSNSSFYYRQSVHFFPIDWSEGTALLVSDRPISTPLPQLSDAETMSIAGGYWDCNILYQEEDWIGCVYLSGLCYDCYQYYWERWVCSVVDEGTCAGKTFVRYQESPCIEDFIYDCGITGEWFYYWMRACK
jgi:hypothetical protein